MLHRQLVAGNPGHSASDPDDASICRARPPHEAQPSTLRSPSPVLLHRVNSRIRHFRQAVRALPYLAASAPWRARLICKLALEGVAAHLQIYAVSTDELRNGPAEAEEAAPFAITSSCGLQL
jgi:hypothetical protein